MARKRLILACAALLALSACGSDRAATQSGKVYYYGLQGGAANSAGMHTVERRETPWSIAQSYRLPVQDIITVNRLSPPYKLKEGQRITLPPPPTYVTRPGDTLYGISRTFGVSTTQLAQMNSIRAPYAVWPGQTLRLPHPQPVSYTPPPAPVPKRYYSPSQPAWAMASAPQTGGRFAWPVEGYVISAYGPKQGGLHNDGINIKAPRGAPVRAADGGTVVYAGHELKGFGNLILLRHADRWMTAYAHMDRLSVKRGDKVGRGQVIGAIGSTGMADAPQLHFEVRHETEAINPMIYLGPRA
jgi:murein DD-endopeptidase MepM/ murein hydrolase activator NlpD